VNVRRGWGVAIRRDDGSEFLAYSGLGILPAVWTRAQRRFAVAHRRDLRSQGFNAHVIEVKFCGPAMISSGASNA